MDSLLDRWPSKVKRFNKAFASGTPVTYIRPSGKQIETQTQFPIVIMSDGTLVIWLEKVTGYCDL